MFSFQAEQIFNLGAFKVTNTVIDTLLVDLLIIAGIIFIERGIKFIPGLFQNAIELVVQTFYGLTESIAQERTELIFPFFMSFFIFILIANYTSLLPGVSSIGFFEGKKLIPIIRSATSDLNVTLGFSILSVVATHILSIRTIGFKSYLSRYISLNPINFFIGILEIISEITKIISLSFRLFGNIYTGEVVLFTISTIFAFIFPLPFLALEIILGFVQALIFAMLTMVFMAILTTPHHETVKAKEVGTL